MDQTLAGRKIVLGVTGSIAAYKAADLTSKLVKLGAEVTPVMTAAAATHAMRRPGVPARRSPRCE